MTTLSTWLLITVHSAGLANEEKKYEEALEYFTKSMELSLQLEDTISVSQMQMNIGLIYYNTDNYQKAIEYYDQAYKGYVSKDYTLGIIVVLGNKAVALGTTADAWKPLP